MNAKENLQKEFNDAYQILQNTMTKSFEYVKFHPEDSEEITQMWTQYIKQIVADTTNLSEQYNNNKIVKAITKTLLFGR